MISARELGKQDRFLHLVGANVDDVDNSGQATLVGGGRGREPRPACVPRRASESYRYDRNGVAHALERKQPRVDAEQGAITSKDCRVWPLDDREQRERWGSDILTTVVGSQNMYEYKFTETRSGGLR